MWPPAAAASSNGTIPVSSKETFPRRVYPLLLGTGKRLFGEGTVPAGLRLTSSQAFPKGAVHLAYEPAGKPKHGDLSVKG